MTFSDLLAGLPNGLHDAGLTELAQDIREQTLTLTLEIATGDPDALTQQAREVKRPARLTFRHVEGLTVERPGNRRPIEQLAQPEWVSGQLDAGPGLEASDLEAVAIFRHETNSFIRFRTADVTLEWLEDEGGYR
jgi:hypothetical protein